MIKKFQISIIILCFLSEFAVFSQDFTQSFQNQNFANQNQNENAEILANQNAHASQENAIISSVSTVNWTKYDFSSDLSLDVQKSKIPMPSGRAAAVNKIKRELPILIKDPLLSIYVNDTYNLSDLILSGTLTLEQMTKIIDSSQEKPAFFTEGGKKLLTNHALDLREIASLLVKHRSTYTQFVPIQTVASRTYTGIVIDARGKLPVHGEFVESEVEPCLFPKIWNENMDLIYEKNMVEPEIARLQGIVHYSSSKIIEDYAARVGKDPLWITAKEVFGINRVDPIISMNDYLKITSVQQNLDLLKNGKVVILLDEENLVHKVSVPERNRNYFLAYQNLQRYFYENKIPDTVLKEGPSGISITMKNLNFIADSAELLPEERPRIEEIAKSLKNLTSLGEFTILVEGHTADVNKPNGQMQLSIERAQAIISLLVEYGVDENIFTYRGYGGTRPIADNSTPEGRAQNRRVEITAIPKSSYVMSRE